MILTLASDAGTAGYLDACSSLSHSTSGRVHLIGDGPSAETIGSELLRRGFQLAGEQADIILGVPGCDRAEVHRAFAANPSADVVHSAVREPFVAIVALHKSGTNLVAELMSAFGYEVSGEGTGPSPYPDGLWEKNEADYLPRLRPGSAYIVHSLPLPTVGGPLQYPRPLFYRWCETPFPVIFHYRDPRAVLLSLIRYLLKQNSSNSFTELPFHRMYSRILHGLPRADQRLAHAIENLEPYLTWSFRDNAWLLDHPEVLTTTYEALVGAEGGGEDGKRDLAVAELMIKLGIPGNPAEIASSAYNPHARTFALGLAYQWAAEYTDEHRECFYRRYADILKRFGYPETPQEGARCRT